MDNYEKFRDEIIEIIGKARNIAIENGKPVSCSSISCDLCDWGNGKCDGITFQKYYDLFKEWANAEYVEPPRLTKAERAFCEWLVSGCYIARDSSGDLYIYIRKPVKGGMVWGTPDETCERWSHLGAIFNVSFPFIKWEDEKPWSVADLLKLEVQDETD